MKKKALILFLLVFLLATTTNAPSSGIDITGWFLKASSVLVNIAKAVVKQILSAVVSVL